MCNIPILFKKDISMIETRADWLLYKREREERYLHHSIRSMKPEIRETIKQRDKICRMCGNGKNLHVHHIKNRLEYPELVNDVSNLVLICIECHDFIHDGLLSKMKRGHKEHSKVCVKGEGR